MKKSRYTQSQIYQILKEAEVPAPQGLAYLHNTNQNFQLWSIFLDQKEIEGIYPSGINPI